MTANGGHWNVTCFGRWDMCSQHNHILTLDLETRSAVDLKHASYRRYAGHHTTGILCIGLQLSSDANARVYRPQDGITYKPGDLCPPEILYAVKNGLLVYAHNKQFDANVWAAQAERLGWPAIPEDQWRCTMSVCSYYALPRKLEKAAAALDLPLQKDMTGHRVMMQCTKPYAPGKKLVQKYAAQGVPAHLIPLQWREDEGRLSITAEYCRRDVEVQTALLTKLGHLPPARLRDWQLDQKINARGVCFDLDSLLNTQGLIDSETRRANSTIKTLTGDAVGTVGQRDRILQYLKEQGLELTDLTKGNVTAALARTDLSDLHRTILTLRESAGKASVKKIKSMLDNVDSDGRARDALVWHKASTGRFAGRAWQPHNFPRKALSGKEADEFHRVLREEEDPVGFLTRESGVRSDFFALLSQALRSYIVPSSGNVLKVSDFASIEARVCAWLAGCKAMLIAFREKQCVYSQFASRVYNKPIRTKGPERQLGKTAVLGLQYGMGHEKFAATAAADPTVPDISKTRQIPVWDKRLQLHRVQEVPEAKIIVDLYRSTYPEIPKFWNTAEQCLIEAVRGRKTIQYGFLQYGSNGDWAWIVLPSGRPIWYNSPVVEEGKDRWGRHRFLLSYMTIDPIRQTFVRRNSWGGILVENVTQAVAADLLIEAMHRVEADGRFPVVLTVHDEIVSEGAPGNLDDFHTLMTVCPSWAPGCPVEAESHESGRYGK